MKQAELHRHLDVALRAETLFHLAQKKHLDIESKTLAEFKEKLFLKQPMSNLSTVLKQFSLFQKVLDHPEILEQTAFEAMEDCWNEGTSHVEFRYSPSFISEFSELSWNDSLLAFQNGIQRAQVRYPEMKVGLICIASREFGQDMVHQTMEFFLKNSKHFVGVDLAGPELEFPCRIFESTFKQAIQNRSKITIHAGEGSGPESIWEAIELLGAQRIGHGVSCTQDHQLVRFLAERKICLEMCPTSNWITQCVPDLSAHPLPKLLREGVPVCINTDDPGIFGITLGHEIRLCQEKMRMSSTEIEQCQLHAFQASFIF